MKNANLLLNMNHFRNCKFPTKHKYLIFIFGNDVGLKSRVDTNSNIFLELFTNF